MTDFHGIELRALWDEMKFDVHHAWQIERCAVVGDRAWEAWMSKLSRPIFSLAEIRFFDVAERDKAWEWINEGTRTPPGIRPDQLESSIRRHQYHAGPKHE